MNDQAPVEPSAAPTPTGAPQAGNEPTPTPAPAAPVAAAPNDPPPLQTSWVDGISDPKVKEFASRFTSPAEAAKFALESRQKLSNAINIPGKDAKPEEIAEFHKKLGVPEKPDAYEIPIPDGLVPDELKEAHNGALNEFRAAMHKAGATPAAVKAAAEWFYQDIVQSQAAQKAAVAEHVANAEAQLRKEWGGDFDANVEHARREFGRVDPEFADIVDKATVDGVSLRNHPAMLRVFAAYGRSRGEGDAHIAMDADQKQTAASQVDALTNQIEEARMRGESSTMNRLIRERDALARRLYPDAA